MEDDAYSVFLAQASRAARLEADPAAEEYVDPIQSVATFTGRVAQLLGDFAEDEVYEAGHWTRQLGSLDARDNCVEHRSEVAQLLQKHDLRRNDQMLALTHAAAKAESGGPRPAARRSRARASAAGAEAYGRDCEGVGPMN